MESKEEPESLEFCLTEWERGGMKGGGLDDWRFTEATVREREKEGGRERERERGREVDRYTVGRG